MFQGPPPSFVPGQITLEFEKPKAAKVEAPVYERPPLGLMPRKFWLTERSLDIVRALTEYFAANKVPKVEWAEELTDIVTELAHHET